MKQRELEYGPVVIEGWFNENRIGYYDDDDVCDDDENEDCAVVYPGNMFISMDLGYYVIPYEHIRPVTTDDLMMRREELHKLIGVSLARLPKDERPPLEARYRALVELSYVEGVLMDRIFEARFGEHRGKKEVFISHSSKDKNFAKWLAVDLANTGHKPWLDEWDIKVGESIPKRINEGIRDCDFVVVILTDNSVRSNWVETEWQAKYWDEIQVGEVKVIPALFSDCEIPTLLKMKKYADFRESYSDGFEDLILAVNAE